jgi:DNA polymerase-1
MHLSQLLHAGAEVPPLSKGLASHALDAVCQRELGVELDKSHQKDDWEEELTPEMVDYAARDAEVLVLLHRRLLEEIENANLSRTLETERRALPAILWMTHAGVPLDEARWLDLAKGAKNEADQIGARLRDMIHPHPSGKEWNWNSAPQVKEALAAFGIHPLDTRDETLAQYDHEFAGLLRDYRKKSKLASSYGEKWLHRKDGSRQVVDDRIYPSWKQIGAATGRMACSDPNLQSIPHGSGHHSCIRATGGRVLIRADFSQIELRLGAKMWNESAMLAAFREGNDIHITTARSLTGRSNVTAE